jgi:hypothetical protein
MTQNKNEMTTDFSDEGSNYVALEAFGRFFGDRKTTIGKRLKGWYKWAVWLFVGIVAVCLLYPVGFWGSSHLLGKAFNNLGSIEPLTRNQVLILYYSGKIGILIILFTPFIWILRRITQLQTDRKAMADKEAAANTLQAIYYSSFDSLKEMVAKEAIQQMFPFAPKNKKLLKKKKKSVTIAANEVDELIAKLEKLILINK